jgi:hypothetical protein
MFVAIKYIQKGISKMMLVEPAKVFKGFKTFRKGF